MFHAWLKILDKSPSSVLWLIRIPPEAGKNIDVRFIITFVTWTLSEANVLAETERINSKLKSQIVFTNKLAREEVSKAHMMQKSFCIFTLIVAHPCATSVSSVP